MTRQDSSYNWLIYVVVVGVVQVVCVTISFGYTSRLYKDPNETAIAGPNFDRYYVNTMVKSQPNENSSTIDPYYSKSIHRSKRSKANKAHGECSKMPPESCENRCFQKSYIKYSYSVESVPLCSCDSACNDIFMDCCSDYTKHCGTNKEKDRRVYSVRSYFHCETELRIFNRIHQKHKGVWMIDRCPMEWSNDVVRDKCHAPPSELNNQSYDAYTPVFNDNLIYRNQYCALCHNVKRYKFMNLHYSMGKPYPAQFNKERLMIFIEKNEHFAGIEPKYRQRLRYCYYPKVIKTCANQSHSELHDCLNGTVELVLWDGKVYKNRACSSCHGVKSPCKVPQPKEIIGQSGGSIGHAVDLQEYGVSLLTTICARDKVFDFYSRSCRRSYRPLRQFNSRDLYLVEMSLYDVNWWKTTRWINEWVLPDDLAENFKLNKSQVTNVQLSAKPYRFLITFVLHMTPRQSLIQSSHLQALKSSETVTLQKLFKFKKYPSDSFDLQLRDDSEGTTNFTVRRVAVRRLACIHSRIYGFHEYVVLRDQRIYVNSTGAVYEQYEYEINKASSKPNVTVCSKLIPLQCNKSYINLNPSEYRLLPNLTLVYKSSKYDFGDYAYENETVYICVGFNKTYQISTTEKPKSQLILTILTYVGFILSVVCLLGLIVTYSIFKQLRSLPGKNLINLAISLALAEILWVSGSFYAEKKALCAGIAIANHYFFLVYFTASSVIAFHSCSVFGRTIPLRRSEEEKDRQFLFHLLIVWGVPALFVLTSSLLDNFDIFAIEYGGGTCWLGTGRSILLLFVLPFGALMISNLTLFLFITVRLCKNRKSNSQMLANHVRRKRSRENVLICIKLSTLMGFSWLFILLHVVVKWETDVFLYLFVIFVSFQGVFICVAFLFNRKCFELYRGLMSKNTSRSSNGLQNRTTKRNMQETTL